jgi:hypothetical protein
MRLDPSLMQIPHDAALEVRLAARAAAYAAQYCLTFDKHNRLFQSESASAIAALTVGLVAARSGSAPHAEWMQASLDGILETLPARAAEAQADGAEAWPIVMSLVSATKSGVPPVPPEGARVASPVSEGIFWSAVAGAAADPGSLLRPTGANDPRLTRAGAFALWSLATFDRGEIAAAA